MLRGDRWFSHHKAGHNEAGTPRANSAPHRLRTAAAWAWWVTGVLVLIALGSLALPPMVKLVDISLSALASEISGAFQPQQAATSPAQDRGG